MNAFMSLSLVLLLSVLGTNFALGSEAERARREKEHLQQMEKQMDEMQKLMDQAFSDFGQFDKMMDDFRRRFFQDDLGGGEDWGQLFDRFNSLSLDRDREFQWKETEKERHLEFKFKSSDNEPIDIKVDAETIKIKGKTESVQKVRRQGKLIDQKSVVQFDRTFSVPADVDGTAAVIEQMDGGIRIRFPKKQGSMTPGTKKTPRLRPIEPSQGDSTI